MVDSDGHNVMVTGMYTVGWTLCDGRCVIVTDGHYMTVLTVHNSSVQYWLVVNISGQH